MRPPFDRKTLEGLKAGDPFTIHKFASDRHSIASKMVRWHFAEFRGFSAALESRIVAEAIINFIRAVQTEEVAQPQCLWLELLLRRIEKHKKKLAVAKLE